jgi:hypothetical protein
MLNNGGGGGARETCFITQYNTMGDYRNGERFDISEANGRTTGNEC